MGKIDVVMPTWNSNGWWFPNVLKSVIDNLDLCHLVLVDRNSHDGTLETAQSLIPQNKLKIIKSDENLAVARRIGIECVDTDLFAFVDSDIELCKHWFKHLYPLVSEDVGALQATEINAYEGAHSSTRLIEQLVSPRTLTIMDIVRHGLFNRTRGMTTQTLVRTNIMIDWKPSSLLCSFEDYSITQHIISKGFKWIRVNYVTSSHHKYPKSGKSNFSLVRDWYLWNGAGAKASREFSFNILMINFFARILGAGGRYVRRKISIEQLLLILVIQCSILEGFLLSSRYLVNYR